MAKQTQGILGVVKGKIGNVVGAQWKQSPYFRSYSVPANPNTTAQQVQRGKMAWLVWHARLILGAVINSYISPFQKAMSGYNRFVQMNIKNLSDTPLPSEMLVAEGQLEGLASVTNCDYEVATGEVGVEWPATIVSNGAATDKICVVVFDEENRRAWTFDAVAERQDEETYNNIASGLSADDLSCFLFFHRGEGDDLIVSNSIYSAVSTRP